MVSPPVAGAAPTLHTPRAAGTAGCAAAHSTRTAEKFLSADSSVYSIIVEKGVLIQKGAGQKLGQLAAGREVSLQKLPEKLRLSWGILIGKLSTERVSLHTQLPLRQKGVRYELELCKQQYNVKQIFFD